MAVNNDVGRPGLPRHDAAPGHQKDAMERQNDLFDASRIVVLQCGCDEQDSLPAAVGDFQSIQGTEGARRSTAPPRDGLNTAPRGLNGETGINQLKSDGDRTAVAVKGEFTAQTGIGHKGQFDYQIDVVQRGGPQPGKPADAADPPKTFQVTLDAQALKPGLHALPDHAVAHGRRQTDGTVTFSFANKEDVQQAVDLLRREVVAKSLNDAANRKGSATPPDTAPAADRRQATNSVARDVADIGTGKFALHHAAAQVQPSDVERRWLQENITTISTRIDVQGRDQVQCGLPFQGPLSAYLESKFDHVTTLARSVDYTDGNPTKLSFEINGDLPFDAKAQSNLDQDLGATKAGVLVSAQGGHARADVSASVAWDIPPGRAGAVVEPFLNRGDGAGDDPLRKGALGQPSSLDYSFSTRLQTLPVAEASQSAFVRLNVDASIALPPSGSAQVVDRLFDHNLRGALATAGQAGGIAASVESVHRSDTAIKTDSGFKMTDAVSVKSAASVEADTTTITGRTHLLPQGSAPSVNTVENQAAEPNAKPVPLGTDNQAGTGLVVTPRDGLSLRSAPEQGSTGVFRHGDFVRQTGDPVTTSDGFEWIPVEGRTMDGARREGWISSDYVRLHPKEHGAMDANGRTNPNLDVAGYQRIEMQGNETLWDIARQTSTDFNELVALNSDHIIKPDLIFAGDTVFLPGTAGQAASTEIDDASLTNNAAENIASPSLNPIDGNANPDSVEDEQNETPTNDSVEAGSDDEMSVGRRTLDEIRADFQVVGEDGEVEWRPNIADIDVPGLLDGARGWGVNIASLRELTGEDLTLPMRPTEAKILDGLGPMQQVEYLEISVETLDRAQAEFPRPESYTGDSLRWSSDGHLDSFRHAYWSARMTQSFGEEWTRAYTSSHEAHPNHEANREAMGLYNNSIGIETAVANPDASTDELASLVRQRIEDGHMVLINGDGSLAWSNQVRLGDHGEPFGGPLAGVIPLPDPADLRAN